ncbi:hypothetical protein BGZ98_006617 [Dissophora globulifera]|nr:hypothetical protein BGZ98_006617 [Dissophora globulifera]
MTELNAFRGHKTAAQKTARPAKVEAQFLQADWDAKALEVLGAYQPNGRVVNNMVPHYFVKYKGQQPLFVKGTPLKPIRILRRDVNKFHAIAVSGLDYTALSGRSQGVPPEIQVYFGSSVFEQVYSFTVLARLFVYLFGLLCSIIRANPFDPPIHECYASVTPLARALPELNLQEIVVRDCHVKIMEQVQFEKGIPRKFIDFKDNTVWGSRIRISNIFFLSDIRRVMDECECQ